MVYFIQPGEDGRVITFVEILTSVHPPYSQSDEFQDENSIPSCKKCPSPTHALKNLYIKKCKNNSFIHFRF